MSFVVSGTMLSEDLTMPRSTRPSRLSRTARSTLRATRPGNAWPTSKPKAPASSCDTATPTSTSRPSSEALPPGNSSVRRRTSLAHNSAGLKFPSGARERAADSFAWAVPGKPRFATASRRMTISRNRSFSVKASPRACRSMKAKSLAKPPRRMRLVPRGVGNDFSASPRAAKKRVQRSWSSAREHGQPRPSAPFVSSAMERSSRYKG
mmetsp:Transcript_88739/g.248280  ORF Transcript_88739/g.248280 Transcript_88739/m.248280 type:complete len:208 (+) Transcript_88739:1163-1786(+)